jgi:hypothetical protein
MAVNVHICGRKKSKITFLVFLVRAEVLDSSFDLKQKLQLKNVL